MPHPIRKATSLTLIESVLERLEYLDWSIADLSRASGIDAAAISSYRTGRVRPSMATVRRLLESVGLEVHHGSKVPGGMSVHSTIEWMTVLEQARREWDLLSEFEQRREGWMDRASRVLKERATERSRRRRELWESNDLS